MQLKKGTLFYFERELRIVFWLDDDNLMLGWPDRDGSQHLSRGDFDEALMAGDVAQSEPRERYSSVVPTNFDELTTAERQQVSYKMQFVHVFIAKPVAVEDAKDTIILIYNRVSTRQYRCPGESTVRRWMTLFKQSGYDPSVLVDMRGRRAQLVRA
jgi:hypothetical protein